MPIADMLLRMVGEGRVTKALALGLASAFAACVGTGTIEPPDLGDGSAPVDGSVHDATIDGTSTADVAEPEDSPADDASADAADTSRPDAADASDAADAFDAADARDAADASDASDAADAADARDAADASDASDSSITDASHDADAPDAAGTVVINFDDLPNGFITAGYKGLVWDTDWYVYNASPTLYQAHSGTQFVTNDLQPGSISFSFPQPVFFEGAWFSLQVSRNAHVHFDVFDQNGTKLGSSADMVQEITPTFLPVNIAGVSKVSVFFNDDFAMDDITYVP